MLLLEGAIWLALFSAICFLYLNFRALQGAREIALQSEEHQLLLQRRWVIMQSFLTTGETGNRPEKTLSLTKQSGKSCLGSWK